MFVFGNIVDWWRSYGGRAIELQRFARRIVSLCASSSGCEKNWSTFQFVSIANFTSHCFLLIDLCSASQLMIPLFVVFPFFFCRCIQSKEIGCCISD